jgi:hypothetical protein
MAAGRRQADANTTAGPASRAVLNRDVVMVSPYTPGVRVAPNGRGHEWRHRNLRASSSETTFDAARAIARRTAERLKQMRERMAGLDVRDRRALTGEARASRVLLPVAPRPPRIVASHAHSRSDRTYVRARLVRRPIGGSTRLPQYVAPTQSEIDQSLISRAEGNSDSSSRYAALHRNAGAPARAKAHKSRAHSRRLRRRAKQRRQASHARIVRSRYRPARRHVRAARIKGYRAGFYRQLASNYFFGGR